MSGRGANGLGQKCEGGGLEGRLPGLGEKEDAFNADNIAQVEKFGPGGIVVPESVGLRVDLESLPFILEGGEEGLSEFAHEDDAAGDAGVRGRVRKCLGGQGCRSIPEARDGLSAGKGGAVGVDPPGENLVALVSADPFVFALFKRGGRSGLGLACHGQDLMLGMPAPGRRRKKDNRRAPGDERPRVR